MRILNIGCGTKTSDDPRVVNIDWSIYLKIKKNLLLSLILRPFLQGERRKRLDTLSESIMVWDLRKGLPFPNESIDIVYHSHFLEHLDQSDAARFIQEAWRVLKPGGIHRIVVPDMEFLCRRYLEHLDICRSDESNKKMHNAYITDIIEQMVRREASGTSRQSPARRTIENILMGDARSRGETHQWMYDEINLGSLLCDMQYEHIVRQTYLTSYFDEWHEIGLDTATKGTEYKPGSLYLEACKPIPTTSFTPAFATQSTS